MIITYQGGNSFKIAQGELSLVLNPQAKASSDVTLFSSNQALPAEALAKAGFVITGPGEYEVKDIFIKGFLSDGREGFNTVYLISFEGMRLCFLGELATPQLKAEVLGNLEDIDILFTTTDAYKLAVSLEPAVIIPMSYDKTSLAQFLKEGGESKVESIDKLVVKKKDLEGKKGEIVVLKEDA